MRKQRGFTLVEILIVMVIIGILATIGLGSFRSSQVKARDATRKNGLSQIAKALEAYYNDKGRYPSSSSGDILGCNGELACTWGSEFSDDLNTIYMVELSSDPRSNRNYFYDSDGTYFQIYARLENTLDGDINTDADDNPQSYSGLDCGGGFCNYGVSSPNSTPGSGRTLVTD